jgi:outer membrane receptor protein involved in Fe transport
MGLEPEEMESYEGFIGYKFSSNIQANVSLYHNRIRDLLTLDAVNSRWENQGILKTSGLELTIDYTFKNLITYLNYTFNNSEDENGNQVAEIAQHGANLGLTYNLNRDWIFNIRGNYLGDRKNPQTITTTGRNEVDSAFVVHGNIGWKYRNWDLHLIVKNIFDTCYYHTSNRPPERYRQPQQTVMFKAQYRLWNNEKE